MIIAPRDQCRKRTPRRCVLALLAAGAVGAAGMAAADDEAARRAELEHLRQRMQSVAEQLARDRTRQSTLRQGLEDLERQTAAARRRLAALDREIAAARAESDRLQAERREAEQRLQAQSEALAAQLRSAYLMGSQSRVRLLLSQERPQQVGRMLVYFDAFNRARLAQLRRIEADMARLESLAEALRANQARLAELEAAQHATLESLGARSAERERQMAAVAASIGDSEKALERLQAQERELEALLEALRQALAAAPERLPPAGAPFPQLRGRLLWPVRGALLAEFGAPKADGRLRWNGIWIAADEGIPVRAAAEGRVAYVGWMQRFGLLVILEHSDGYFTLYGHCAAALVDIGASVRPGQTLAQAGASGGHEQTGVYFEVRQGAKPLDPTSWLARK